MSPREAFRRIVLPLAPQQGGESGESSSSLDEVQNRLSSILAQVSATPVEKFAPATRTQPRRNPADALQWYIVLDAFALFVGFIVSWVVAALTHIFVLERGYFMLDPMVELISAAQYLIVAVGVMVWFGHTGHYRRRMPLWQEIQSVANGLFFAMIFNGFFQFALKQDFSRIWLMAGWVFAAFSILLFRCLARGALSRRGQWHIRTLLVGSGTMADEARSALRAEAGLGYEIVAQIDNLPLMLAQADNSWERLCDHFEVDYILIALEGGALTRADSAIADLVRANIPFSVMPPLRHLPVLGMSAQYFFSRDIIMMSPVNNLEQPMPRFIKRSMDILVAGGALIVLSPLLAVIALWVKRDGGPAFFGDIRVGYKSKAFHCLKFRSMVMNGDEILRNYLAANPDKKREWELYHKLQDDPRVTGIGKFLRSWSLDELPQLINVLRGDMSLVGPRPIMFRERNVYSSDIVHYARVRPGLTGVWQISGRSDVSFSRRVQMDSWYVRNWSLWHDIAILFKTIPVILNKTGAY